MKSIIRIRTLLFYIAIMLLVACNHTKSDAKKAAKYTNKSIELAREMKLEKSETYYLKAQKIMEKYRETKHEEDFFKHYQKFRDETRNKEN